MRYLALALLLTACSIQEPLCMKEERRSRFAKACREFAEQHKMKFYIGYDTSNPDPHCIVNKKGKLPFRFKMHELQTISHYNEMKKSFKN